jgi:hypothetical protein
MVGATGFEPGPVPYFLMFSSRIHRKTPVKSHLLNISNRIKSKKIGNMERQLNGKINLFNYKELCIFPMIALPKSFFSSPLLSTPEAKYINYLINGVLRIWCARQESNLVEQDIF